VDGAAGRIVAVKPLAAWAAHPAVRLLRQQQFAAFPHRIFSRGPISLITPGLKIRIGAVRQEHLPRGFKIGAGFVEGDGRAVLLVARIGSRVKPAMPLPGILVMRVAAADRDGARVHVTVVDVPAFLAGVSRSTAGELGHAALKRGLGRRAPISGPVVFRGRVPLLHNAQTDGAIQV
jgi:hypothetical protein